MKRKWDDELPEAIKKLNSFSEVAEYFGLYRTNYRRFKRRADQLGLDYSHFRKSGYKPKDLSDVLTENSTNDSYKLKLRLFKEGLFEEKCYCCGITEWMGKKAPLELEHINGVHNDNRLENLTILCANCHSQTEFFRGRNIKKYKDKNK
jgi:hypothetical protein